MTFLPDDGDDEHGREIPDFGFGVCAEFDDSLDFLAGPGDAGDAGGSGAEVAVFSVSNPAQTVTATASIDGRLWRIALDPGSRSLAELSEHELGREILLVGQLAWRRARAGLFDFLLERTSEAGEDVDATRRFLRDDVGLPTPEQAAAELAEAFAERLGVTDD